MSQWPGLTAVCEVPGSNPNTAVMFIVKATGMYSPGNGLHTITAICRSTQPSTLCGIVK